jgi:prevent-host-death family protein
VKQVGVYDAKTHLPALLDEVEKGETITITRHGRPVARLTPIEGTPRRRSVDELIEAARSERKGRSLGGIHPKDLINYGRKY